VDAVRHEALREHIQSLWQGDECSVIACAQCGFCHADPYIAGDARFYELAYERTGYPAWKWEFGMTRDTITRLVEGHQLCDFHLLEIGAGDGAFLKQIIPALTASDRVLATEYSDYGIREIKKLGIECLPVDVRELSVASYAERFHVVCLFQVLEHMDRLDALFRQLDAITAPNAHVFIAVPNELKVEFNENNGSLLEMPPNHIGRWTQHGFAIIAERNGWRVAEHRREIEGFCSKAVRHMKFAHARRAQNPRSLANLLERTSSAALRKSGIAADIAMNAWRTVPALWRLARNGDLGDSQWVWLRKACAP
jgi:SAM-dependent methyltransferase